ncbi:hypothetical protein T439DRAFT_384226 [Meredithblackwellia eburnea MCA 4105]
MSGASSISHILGPEPAFDWETPSPPQQSIASSGIWGRERALTLAHVMNNLRLQSTWLSLVEQNSQQNHHKWSNIGPANDLPDMRNRWEFDTDVLDLLIQAATLRLEPKQRMRESIRAGKEFCKKIEEYREEGSLVFNLDPRDDSEPRRLTTLWKRVEPQIGENVEESCQDASLQIGSLGGDEPSLCEQVQIKTLTCWLATIERICQDVSVSTELHNHQHELSPTHCQPCHHTLNDLVRFFASPSQPFRNPVQLFSGNTWQEAIDETWRIAKHLQNECVTQAKQFKELRKCYLVDFSDVYRLFKESKLVNLKKSPPGSATLSLGRGRMTARQERFYRQVGATY